MDGSPEQGLDGVKGWQFDNHSLHVAATILHERNARKLIF
jgi:hypothetical protein